MQEISVKELHKIIKNNDLKNYIIVDVRSKPEHKSVRIAEAINIPLEEIQKHVQELNKYETVFLHCQSGKRSQEACKILSNLKHAKVVNIQGGILQWQSQGFEVNKTKGFHLPIIQQVHLIAGILTLTGAILSKTLNPNWIYLPMIIGAGLTFAGATGWCGMAKILQKMPWNK